MSNRYGKVFLLLEYLIQNTGHLGANQGKSTDQILVFLLENTPWGREIVNRYDDDVNCAKKKELRNVQNLMANLTEDSTISEFLVRESPGAGNNYLYRVDGEQVSKPVMDIEEALTLRLAEQFLQHALPAEFHEDKLNTLFRAARDRLQAHEAGPDGSIRAVNQFRKRVAISQRGQQLVSLPSQVPLAQLGILSKAILEKKQVACTYRGQEKTLHPYGIVIREPKIYLLAVEDHVMTRFGSDKVEPCQYLCSRIVGPRVVSISNKVPDDFDAMAHVAKGKMDVALRKDIGLSDRAFTLVLKVVPGKDNLVNDLAEYPLSQKQTLEQDADSSAYILRAANMRLTYQLVEWIMARMDRVEVLSPHGLRSHMQKKIASMHQLYES